MTAPDHHQNGHGAAVLVALDGSSAAATALPVARLVAAECDLSADRVDVVPIGPAVASQVGPGAFGVAVVEAESR